MRIKRVLCCERKLRDAREKLMPFVTRARRERSFSLFPSLSLPSRGKIFDEREKLFLRHPLFPSSHYYRYLPFDYLAYVRACVFVISIFLISLCRRMYKLKIQIIPARRGIVRRRDFSAGKTGKGGDSNKSEKSNKAKK